MCGHLSKLIPAKGQIVLGELFPHQLSWKKIFSIGFVGEAQIGGEHIFQESLNCKENFYFSTKYDAFVDLKRNAITKK